MECRSRERLELGQLVAIERERAGGSRQFKELANPRSDHGRVGKAPLSLELFVG